MIKYKDKEYLNNPDYSLALDSLFRKDRSDNVSADFAYPYTNENLNAVFRYLAIKGGRVATVGSSGDQALNAIYYGAKDVTIIDANLYAKPVIELKIAGIKNLTRREFKDWWIEENILSPEMYAKISHSIPEESRMFWDIIMLEMGSDKSENAIKAHDIFGAPFGKDDWYTKSSRANEYLDDLETYARLKKNLESATITYKCAEFSDFIQELDGRYDSILLSNVMDYISNHTYFMDVVKGLQDYHLTDDGKIQVLYEYSSTDNFFQNRLLEEFKSRGIKRVSFEKIKDIDRAREEREANGGKLPLNSRYFNGAYDFQSSLFIDNSERTS